jgi:hypothetical protein
MYLFNNDKMHLEKKNRFMKMTFEIHSCQCKTLQWFVWFSVGYVYISIIIGTGLYKHRGSHGLLRELRWMPIGEWILRQGL